MVSAGGKMMLVVVVMFCDIVMGRKFGNSGSDREVSVMRMVVIVIIVCFVCVVFISVLVGVWVRMLVIVVIDIMRLMCVLF